MGRGTASAKKMSGSSGTRITTTGTMSENKSSEQVYKETNTLESYPSGTQIEVYENGNWETYTAHDVARTGRNGRIVQRRRYSIINDNATSFRNLTSSTTDPYYLAQKRWRKKNG